jgi:hypothetical protein
LLLEDKLLNMSSDRVEPDNMKVRFGSDDEGKKFIQQFPYLPAAEAPQHNLLSIVQSPFKHRREYNLMAGNNFKDF